MKNLNSIKENQYIFLIWELTVVALFYLIFGVEWLGKYGKIQILITALCTLIITLFIHELVHMLVIKLFSKEKVTFGAERSKFFIKCIYVHTDAILSNWKWIIIKLAPFMILTVIPVIVMLVGHCPSLFVFFLSLINCAAAYKDLLDTVELLIK